MIDINASSSFNFNSSTLQKAADQESAKNLTTPIPVITKTNLDSEHISGEAQYVFEMDVYLNSLSKDEKADALDFLSKSDDPLHKKALENFNKSEEVRSKMTDEVMKSIAEQSKQIDATAFKAMVRDPALGPEIAVIPNGTAVYRLDGKDNFYPTQLDTSNTKLKEKLDALESNIPSSFNIQDKANLVGTVRNALYASESIQLSFDDVLNFNYMQEKARTTINQTNAPDDLKSKLNEILDQSVSYQNTKQSNFLSDAQKYVNNSNVGAIAKENIRLGTAAQAYNNEFKGVLSATKTSVLDAGSLMTNLLSKHTDLIRFSPSKISDAIAFYKQDFDTYQDFVKNGYKPPEEHKIEFDSTPLAEGHNYALKVIEEIQNYVSKGK